MTDIDSLSSSDGFPVSMGTLEGDNLAALFMVLFPAVDRRCLLEFGVEELPVDVADPRFVYIGGGSSSLVDGAFYDADNRYMIISLNGTAYHYCGLPTDVWSTLTAASSLGSFYNTQIKGHFDCRTGAVPQYQQ